MPDILDTQLSAHFKLREFVRSAIAEKHGIDNTPPDDCLPLLKEFCVKILEPLREKFGAVFITSGYRCPQVNALAHGSPTSDHQWSPSHIAADCHFLHPLRNVFDWLRLESKLAFDQCILEFGKIPDTETDDCIHISYRVEPRRIALVGETHNRAGYDRVEVV